MSAGEGGVVDRSWKVSDQIRDDVARKSICQHSFPDQQDRFLIFTSWNSQARGPGCGWVPWVLGNYLETIWKLFGNHLVKDASWTSVGKPFALLHGDYSNPIQRRLCWEKSKERAHRPDFPDLASLPWGRLWGQLQQAQVHRRCSLLCREGQHCGEICTKDGRHGFLIHKHDFSPQFVGVNLMWGLLHFLIWDGKASSTDDIVASVLSPGFKSLSTIGLKITHR